MNKIKVLLLDDDNQVRFNLKLFFEDEGFDCDSFENSESALNSLRNNSYDIAIVDLRLPGMDGEEFICVSSSIAPGLKYIIYTGSAQYRLPEKLKAIGINITDVFYKPVSDMNLFVAKINQMLNRN